MGDVLSKKRLLKFWLIKEHPLFNEHVIFMMITLIIPLRLSFFNFLIFLLDLSPLQVYLMANSCHPLEPLNTPSVLIGVSRRLWTSRPLLSLCQSQLRRN